ncbi:MAG TPA: hypothetical protein VE734_10405 [Terriglobales bacterium]|jgi:hypothetical protein|nr:hypothetical protein [Terriglobales bacterium]
MDAKQLGELIDELGAIEEEIAPLKGKIKRAEALRKMMAAAHTGAAGEGLRLAGKAYVALVSARDTKRYVKSMRGAAKALGMALFYKLATVTLGALEENLPPETCAQLIASEQSGPRHVTTYRLAAEKAA